MRLTGPCSELKHFLNRAVELKIAFDCVGGCGIDMSVGSSSCMDASGVWFKFCPFCGARIVQTTSEIGHEWWEAAPENVVEIVNAHQQAAGTPQPTDKG